MDDSSDPENDPLAFLLDPNFQGPWIPDKPRPNWTRWDIPPDDPAISMGALRGGLPGSKFGMAGNSNEGSQPRKLVEHQLGRIYVGDLPDTNVDELREFFNKVMAEGQGASRQPGDSVIQVFYNPLRRYAFLEVRDIEETMQLLELDGIYFKGSPLRLGRPPGFNFELFERIRMGKHAPPQLKVSIPRKGKQYEYIKPDFGPTRLKIENIPKDLDEKDLRQILEAFGPLKGLLFNKNDTKEEKFVSCLCLYKDTTVNSLALKGLDGLQILEGRLHVREAVPGKDFPAMPINLPILAVPAMMNLNRIGHIPGGKQDVIAMMGFSENVHGQSIMNDAIGTSARNSPRKAANPSPAVLENQAMEMPTRVLILLNMVNEEDLADDDEYEDLCDDIEEECSRFGEVRKILIPRPAWHGTPFMKAIGKVFVQYEELTSAILALTKIRGRKFNNHTVDGGFWPEDQFENLKLGELNPIYHINRTAHTDSMIPGPSSQI